VRNPIFRTKSEIIELNKQKNSNKGLRRVFEKYPKRDRREYTAL
jgi:hypothetical protein